jgi:hypothetical protein
MTPSTAMGAAIARVGTPLRRERWRGVRWVAPERSCFSGHRFMGREGFTRVCER